MAAPTAQQPPAKPDLSLDLPALMRRLRQDEAAPAGPAGLPPARFEEPVAQLPRVGPPPPGQPAASAPEDRHEADWNWTNTLLQGLFTAGTIADWRQTQEMIGGGRFNEANPVLGPHPSRRAINTYFPIAIGAHALVSRALGHPWRELWQLGGIGMEGWALQNNARKAGAAGMPNLGFGVRFGF